MPDARGGRLYVCARCGARNPSWLAYQTGRPDGRVRYWCLYHQPWWSHLLVWWRNLFRDTRQRLAPIQGRYIRVAAMVAVAVLLVATCMLARSGPDDYRLPDDVAGTGPAGNIPDGTWQVGIDIQSGRYTTNVPNTVWGCYWQRLADDTGRYSSMIDVGQGMPGEALTVYIKASDWGFHTDGCGTWRRI